MEAKRIIDNVRIDNGVTKLHFKIIYIFFLKIIVL